MQNTEEEAKTYTGKNQLTSALTAWTDPLVEGWFAREIQVPENLIFLLCTDGLWEGYGHKAGQLATDTKRDSLANA